MELAADTITPDQKASDSLVVLVRLLAREAAREYLEAVIGGDAACDAHPAQNTNRGKPHGH